MGGNAKSKLPAPGPVLPDKDMFALFVYLDKSKTGSLKGDEVQTMYEAFLGGESVMKIPIDKTYDFKNFKKVAEDAHRRHPTWNVAGNLLKYLEKHVRPQQGQEGQPAAASADANTADAAASSADAKPADAPASSADAKAADAPASSADTNHADAAKASADGDHAVPASPGGADAGHTSPGAAGQDPQGHPAAEGPAGGPAAQASTGGASEDPPCKSLNAPAEQPPPEDWVQRTWEHLDKSSCGKVAVEEVVTMFKYEQIPRQMLWNELEKHFKQFGDGVSASSTIGLETFRGMVHALHREHLRDDLPARFEEYLQHRELVDFPAPSGALPTVCEKGLAVRKALLVGVNYKDSKEAALQGCVKDMEDWRDLLVDMWGFEAANVTLLSDDQEEEQLKPTAENIRRELKRLVTGDGPEQQLFFGFSGCGSMYYDKTQEKLYECLVPSDYATPPEMWCEKVIKSTELCDIFEELPESACMGAVFDCCCRDPQQYCISQEVTAKNLAARIKFIEPPEGSPCRQKFEDKRSARRLKTKDREFKPEEGGCELERCNSKKHVWAYSTRQGKKPALEMPLDGDRPEGVLSWSLKKALRRHGSFASHDDLVHATKYELQKMGLHDHYPEVRTAHEEHMEKRVYER